MTKHILTTLITAAIGLFSAWQLHSITTKAMAEGKSQATVSPKDTKTAVFAGGCFWCTESDFEKLPGVIEVVSGYSGGRSVDPTYEDVSSGSTMHVEAILVTYDPSKVSYEMLLEYFWRHVDPTDAGGQFVDRGAQYRSVIFYDNEEELTAIEASKKRLETSGRFDKPIATEILPRMPFYNAEAYHQDYHKKNPFRYKFYRTGSGRDRFLKKHWKDEERWTGSKSRDMSTNESTDKLHENSKGQTVTSKSEAKQYSVPDDETLKERLSPMQYKVARRDGTEPPFNNEFWDNHRQGIYVDIVSNEPLFSSTDKFDSGTGWPSFVKPLEADLIVEKVDKSLFMTRTEVRSKYGDTHLGHVFPDGPPPTGLRYCINSASLRFIPKEDLEKEGFEEYMELFE